MKISHIIVHRHAPELNTIHWENGATLRVPGITGLKQYRASLTKPPPMIVATVQTHYPPHLRWLERTYRSKVNTRREALAIARLVIANKLTASGTCSVKTRLHF